MKEDLMIARNNVKSLQDENDSLKRDLNTENPHGHKSTNEVIYHLKLLTGKTFPVLLDMQCS